MRILLSLCLPITLYCLGKSCATSKISPEWWNNNVIYQIGPRSFKDSNGDGNGDLPGIISKLKFIREFADVVWLSPIHPSPQRDFGYDIRDFKNIEPQFGTLKDFDDFLAKAKKLGLRVVLDLVPNHTSDDHPWFQQSVKSISPFKDYFIWRAANYSSTGERLPPNNWVSYSGGSAWKWNDERQQYYYHAFFDSQPDLNHRNKLVQQEIMDIMRFWLDRGVDGFRVDAIAHLYEAEELLDNPLSNVQARSDEYRYYDNRFTRDLNECYDTVSVWKRYLDEYSEKHRTERKALFVEVGSWLRYTIKYYDFDVIPFNFHYLHDLNNRSTAADWKANIEDWMRKMPEGKIANWIVGNHDTPRTASRYGYNGSRADQVFMISSMLPGITIIYNGDEIGMENRFMTYNESQDPYGCYFGPDEYQRVSRDPQRTPYQWDDSVSAGFSTNTKTWLPVHQNYKNLNLAAQQNAPIDQSHYKVFRAVVKLKKSSLILARGDYELTVIDDNVLALVRRLPGKAPIVLLINFTDKELKVNLKADVNVSSEMSVYVASVGSRLTSGETVDTSKLLLPGAATVILSDHATGQEPYHL